MTVGSALLPFLLQAMAKESKPTRSRARKRLAKADPLLAQVIRQLRELLPGDPKLGDPLSIAADTQAGLIGRRIAELTAERPGALREAGLSALQVWEALSEARRREEGTQSEEITIVFTDLIQFSDWALEVGDEEALRFLRDAGEAIEPPVQEHGGTVVKRLGDGMMAVFGDPPGALLAIEAARARLARIDVPEYRPRLRAGMHLGRPKLLGGDYFGVDVNVAARLAEQATGEETLVSDRALAALDASALDVKRKRLFRAKGVPTDVSVYSVHAA